MLENPAVLFVLAGKFSSGSLAGRCLIRARAEEHRWILEHGYLAAVALKIVCYDKYVILCRFLNRRWTGLCLLCAPVCAPLLAPKYKYLQSRTKWLLHCAPTHKSKGLKSYNSPHTPLANVVAINPVNPKCQGIWTTTLKWGEGYKIVLMVFSVHNYNVNQ